MRLRSLLILLAALAFPSQALPAGRESPSLAAGAAARPPVHAHPALWVVKDEDTTIYLFGTIHLLRPEVAWFEGPVRKAYEESDELVVEVTDAGDPALQQKLLQKVYDPSGPTLSSQLPDAARPLFARMEKDYDPSGMLEHVRPWYGAVALSLLPLGKLGYDPASGADRVLLGRAGADGKTITGLETSDQQLDMFDGLPHDLQLTFLVETLNEQKNLDQAIDRMIGAWVRGDPDALARDLNGSMDDDPALKGQLVDARNARWATWIAQRMASPGIVFVAVGAGHLAGKGSVQQQLARLGYRSARVRTH